MTKRDFYKNVMDGNLTDEVMETAADLLQKMDDANAKRAQRLLEKKASADDEKAPIRQALMDALTDEPMTAIELIGKAGLTETVKPASVPSLLKPFITKGEVEKGDVKQKGKSPARGYFKA